MKRAVHQRAAKTAAANDEREPAGKPWQAVRKNKLARARKLLADPSYPSAKVIDSVARLLARHLRPGEES